MRTVLFIVSDDFYFLSHRLSLALYLKEKNYKIIIATTIHCNRRLNQLRQHGFVVYNLNYRIKNLGPLSYFKQIWRIRHIISKARPCIVHAVSLQMAFLSLVAFKFNRAKYFVGMINGLGFLYLSEKKSIKIIRSVVNQLFKLFCLNKNTALICQNQDDYEFLSKNFISQDRLHLIKGSGVDTSQFIAVPEPPVDDGIVVTMVSRFLIDKGVIEVFEAAKLLRQQEHNFIKIQLVGDIHEANPNSLTKKQLAALLEDSGVVWLGQQDNINFIYQKSHIAILPSYREGLPKSLLEAAACGRALISTDVPGCREICKNGYNGTLVPPKNSEALAAAIVNLAKNKAKRDAYGLHSIELVKTEFSVKIINRDVLTVYNKLGA